MNTPTHTTECPCCDGGAVHRTRVAVDDYDERPCTACDSTGEVEVDADGEFLTRGTCEPLKEEDTT